MSGASPSRKVLNLQHQGALTRGLDGVEHDSVVGMHAGSFEARRRGFDSLSYVRFLQGVAQLGSARLVRSQKVARSNRAILTQ